MNCAIFKVRLLRAQYNYRVKAHSSAGRNRARVDGQVEVRAQLLIELGVEPGIVEEGRGSAAENA